MNANTHTRTHPLKHTQTHTHTHTQTHTYTHTHTHTHTHTQTVAGADVHIVQRYQYFIAVCLLALSRGDGTQWEVLGS